MSNNRRVLFPSHEEEGKNHRHWNHRPVVRRVWWWLMRRRRILFGWWWAKSLDEECGGIGKMPEPFARHIQDHNFSLANLD
jgi:hypothetical protein